MSDDSKVFKLTLEHIYENGGSPEYIYVRGLGSIWWPALSIPEKAYVVGWLGARKQMSEELNDDTKHKDYPPTSPEKW